jgi:hypothetical protein
MMILLRQDRAMFEALCVLLLLLCTALPSVADDTGQATNVPAPFITYNATLQIGTSGYVSWDLHAFSGNISLWIQENYPNASVAQIPLNLNTDAGFMAWEAGTNLSPGEYYYEIQLTSGTGIVYKSNPFSIICATCPLSTSASAAPTTTSSSVSHISYSTAYTSSISGLTTMVMPGSTSSSSPTPAAAAAKASVSAGAAAGIGVGAAAAVGIVAVLIWLCSRSRRRRRERDHPATYTQPWIPPAPQQHLTNAPEMNTYPSAPPYKGHNRQLSHELQSAELVPGSPPSESNRSHMYSPPRSPPLQQTNIAPGLSADGRFVQPQPHHLSPQPNQPWMQAGTDGSPHMSYEGSPRSNQESFENAQHGQGSPESQQGLFPRRAVGS